MHFGHVLQEFLDRKTVILDVGCRWGFAEHWKALAPSAELYGFDPDEDECNRIRDMNTDPNLHIISQALGRHCGPQTLYLTQEPACSSIYPPHPLFTDIFPELHCARQVGTTQIELITLDHWATEASVSCIDFIKLDVQGAELDVLMGGEQSLNNVRGLEIEVEFNPIYSGQPLFGDVDRFMREKGFVLWRLGHLVHYSVEPGQGPLPGADVLAYDSRPTMVQPQQGQVFWGHAYYIRPEAAAGGVDMSWDQCLRDAAIFHALGFYDLSSRLLNNAVLNGPETLAQHL